MYDKPFLDYNELLCRLESEYKLNIPDRDAVEHYISTTSYYTLINGYKEVFMTNGKFDDNILLDHIFLFHHFDVGMQNILFKYGLYAEQFFKTKLSYTISKHIGVHQDEYLNSRQYENRYRSYILMDTLANLKKVYEQEHTEDPTRHYKDTKNHIPSWILFQNANFNDVINLYTFLKPPNKEEVSQNLYKGLKIDNLDKMVLCKKNLHMIRKFRNKIAHRMKFISYRVPDEYALPKTIVSIFPETIIRKSEYTRGIGKNNLYGFFLSLLLILDDYYLRIQLLIELKTHIELFEMYDQHTALYKKYLEVTDLPLDFKERLDELFSFYST